MNEVFDKAKELIDSSSRILLTMHEGMDGDDGGALLAMGKQLQAMGKNITCAIKKGVPPQLQFLPGSHKIQNDIAENENFDLLITFGCSALNRTGNPRITNLKCKIVNIDHHPDNTYFGHTNMVDSNKSSVAELIYDFFNHHKWPIDKDVATCLLTGIITDTGSFMHNNTQSSTLKAAAELMKKGALSDKIIRHTYKNKNPKVLKAWGKAIENSYYDSKRKIIFSVITEEDLQEIGQLPQSAFEGFVETLNTVPEAKFALFVRQDGDVIKGSLRSDTFKNVDVSKIAKYFGGGGHKLAAGFSIAGKLIKNEQGQWKVQQSPDQG